ncbi:MAG: hypothetical protein WBN65_10140 [Gammaproteobacteria bacterium]
MRRVPRWILLALLLQPILLVAAEFPGFTVVTPAGDAWRQVQRNSVSIVWMRRTADRTDSFGAAVLTSGLNTRFDNDDGFLDWVRRSKSANPDPGQFALRESSFALDPAVARRCVRYRTLIEVRAAGTLLEVAGLACLHPDAADRYFDVQYSARYPLDAKLGAELAEEGAAFVDSFRFTAVPADGDWSLGSGALVESRRDAA